MNERQYLAAVWAMLALAVVVSALLTAADAHAACPSKPGSMAGGALDAAAVEVRELRREQADACTSIVAAVDVATARLAADGPVATAVGALGPKLDAGNTHAAEIKARLLGTLDVATTRGTPAAPFVVVDDSEVGQEGQGSPAGTEDEPITAQLADDDARQLFSARWLLAFGCGAMLAIGGFSLIRRAWGF